MKRLTTHLSPLLLAAFFVVSLPPALSAEVPPVPLDECSTPLAQEMECDPTDTDPYEETNDDGDVIEGTITCDLEGASVEFGVLVLPGLVTDVVVLVCDYGNCGKTYHVQSLE